MLEGYGLTETAPSVTMNGLGSGQMRLGTVGRPLPGVTILIVDAELKEVPAGEEGEVTISAPMVMRGYHNRPDATNAVFFTHGEAGKRFFRTGDLGKVVDGFLSITGRIKEQFKLENGKFVVPAPLEDHLGRCPLVSQSLIYGLNKPFTVALVVPNLPELAAKLAGRFIPYEISSTLILT